MVVAEAEMMAQAEVNSSGMMAATAIDHQNPKNNHTEQNHRDVESNDNNNGNNHNNNNNYTFPNLGRQSSIYSLTLDEFQHTLCENGKNFGSMNMDEFLNSIWTAEENQAHHGTHHSDNPNSNNSNNPGQLQSANAAVSSTGRGMIAKQLSLPRQGSLTLPAPLCRKTVDEVWSEIHRTEQQDEQQQQQQQHQAQQNQQQLANSNSNAAQRQPTFGEMTLEDFLVKAGVVREQGGPGQLAPTPLAVVPQGPTPPPQAHHHQFGFTNPHSPIGPSFVSRPMMGMAGGGAYPTMPASGDTSAYVGNGKRNNGYPAPAVACYGSRVTNGRAPAGGFGPGAGLTPVSPVSPDGICGPGQVDNPAGQYGLDMAALRGRKRIIDGPVEKVVERRQRRMIKNRESAARSRARKQAYTVELEAELNQLREQNAQLKQALAELERQRKQQYLEEQEQLPATRGQRAQEKLKAMRRSRSCTV